MSGTTEGGMKAKQAILAKDPDFYKRIGQRGGSRPTTGGFADKKRGEDGLTGPERAKIAGAKGGFISRRKAANAKELATPLIERHSPKKRSWLDKLVHAK